MFWDTGLFFCIYLSLLKLNDECEVKKYTEFLFNFIYYFQIVKWTN